LADKFKKKGPGVKTPGTDLLKAAGGFFVGCFGASVRFVRADKC